MILVTGNGLKYCSITLNEITNAVLHRSTYFYLNLRRKKSANIELMAQSIENKICP